MFQIKIKKNLINQFTNQLPNNRQYISIALAAQKVLLFLHQKLKIQQSNLNKVDLQLQQYYWNKGSLRIQMLSQITKNTQIILIIICFGQLLALANTTCLVTNCASCPNATATSCTTCSVGYCSSSNTSCSLCAATLTNCNACSSCSVCTSCIPTYTVLAQQCKLCSQLMPFCNICSSTLTCTTCIAPYVMVGNMCCAVAMPNCLGCANNTALCSSCINITHCLNTPTSCAVCASTMPNCGTCSNCSYCLSCVNDYFALNSTTNKCQLCQKLLPQCQRCSSDTTCTKCKLIFKGINSTGQCQSCQLLMLQCSTCTTSTVCTSCKTNYYAIDPSSKCSLCSSLIPNCLRCTTISTCLLCQNGFAVNSNFKCSACSLTITSCATCAAPSVCTSCLPGYFQVGLSYCCDYSMPFCSGCSNQSICDSCVSNSYCQNTPISCTPCHQVMYSCSTCNSCSNCTACFSGFTFNSNKVCQRCSLLMLNCGICTSATVCTQCISNIYALNPSTQKCDLCSINLPNCLTCSSTSVCTGCINDSYAIDWWGFCSFCYNLIPGCNKCFNNTACKFCEVSPNIVLILSTRQCRNCIDILSMCFNCTSQLFCTVCAQYFAPRVLGNQAQCVSCRILMPGCFTCDNQDQCTKCQYGRIVNAGCSLVIGCTGVDPMLPNSPCVSCDTNQFRPVPVNQECICLKGKIAGQLCTTIPGCNSVIKSGGIEVCVVCSQANKFKLVGGTCVCQRYYEPAGELCKEICGDGKLFNLPCDDGNNISGDGCSSTCRIEYRYICQGQPYNGRSKCVYHGDINLELDCIYKSELKNTFQVILKVKPYISNIEKSSLEGLTFKAGAANASISSVVFQNKQLKIYIQYGSQIDGKTGHLTFSYDPQYIQSADSHVTFQISDCNSKKLKFQEVTTNFQILAAKLSQYIIIAALCDWFLGSFAFKMIGVETINTIQFIAVAQMFAPQYDPTVSSMIGMTYSLGGFQNKISNNKIIFYTPYEEKLNYSASYKGNNQLIFMIQGLSVFIYLTLLALQHGSFLQFIVEKLSLKNRLQQLKQRAYSFLIFPSFIGFLPNTFLALFSFHNRQIQKSTDGIIQQTAIAFAQTIAVFLIFFYQWRSFIIQKPVNPTLRYKPKYVPIYLSFILIVNTATELSIMNIITHKLYVIGGIQVLFTVFLCVYRPYQNPFHNAVLIINKGGILLQIIWLICQEFIQISAKVEENLALSMFSYTGLVLLLSAIRSIVQLREGYMNKQASKKPVKKSMRQRLMQVDKEGDEYLKPYYKQQQYRKETKTSQTKNDKEIINSYINRQKEKGQSGRKSKYNLQLKISPYSVQQQFIDRIHEKSLNKSQMRPKFID